MAAVGAIVGLLVVGWAVSRLYARPDGNPAKVRIQVPSGATLDGLVTTLSDKGLAASPTALRWALRLEGTLDELKAGIYEVPGNAHAMELAELLTGPPKFDGLQLTLRPGLTVWEAAKVISDLGIGTERQLRTLASDHAFATKHVGPRLAGPVQAARTDGFAPTYLEGFIAPETYFVRPDTAPDRLLVRLTGQFMKTWRPLAERYKADRLALKKRYGVSDRDIVIMASLIQREIADVAEARRVAGVFYNRLAKGMKLQTDPTLIYRPDRVGLKPTPTHRRDATNPYNTYAHKGLPPGPICSPSVPVLKATLRPERHEYIYFVAKGGKRHAFAKTYKEHKANIERYLK